MRRLLLLTIVFGTGVAVGALGYGTWTQRAALKRGWVTYQAARATDYEQARRHIAWCETQPQRDAKLQALVARFGTGRVMFDEHLARYLTRPRASESLRAAFSQELGRRPELLERWAFYWTWRSILEPNEELAGVARYLETLALVDAPRALTWREVLDVQAVFTLTDQAPLAAGLSPDNWRERRAKWQPGEDRRLTRPDRPFPDWQGPLPEPGNS